MANYCQVCLCVCVWLGGWMMVGARIRMKRIIFQEQILSLSLYVCMCDAFKCNGDDDEFSVFCFFPVCNLSKKKRTNDERKNRQFRQDGYVVIIYNHNINGYTPPVMLIIL